ncbi:MAG: ATP-binding protein [Bacteroidia bacterium]
MNGKVIINSKPDGVKVVDELMTHLENQLVLDEAAAFKVRLVLSEAIQNAIVHGNEADPSKLVIIEYYVENGCLHCCITDEGKGFDVESIEDARDEMNRDKEGGRGVLFLQELTDAFTYCQQSKSVKFSIKVA